MHQRAMGQLSRNHMYATLFLKAGQVDTVQKSLQHKINTWSLRSGKPVRKMNKSAQDESYMLARCVYIWKEQYNKRWKLRLLSTLKSWQTTRKSWRALAVKTRRGGGECCPMTVLELLTAHTEICGMPTGTRLTMALFDILGGHSFALLLPP